MPDLLALKRHIFTLFPDIYKNITNLPAINDFVTTA